MQDMAMPMLTYLQNDTENAELKLLEHNWEWYVYWYTDYNTLPLSQLQGWH